jgi:SPP1 family predicted phage head-tail adaptor
MRSGGLRQRLVIEQDFGTSSGTLGGRTEDWQTVLEVRARSAYKSGREFERARQIVAEVSTLFVLRYNPSLAPLSGLQKMRIRSLDDNSIHRILFADDPDRRRRQINIYANEGQSS